MDISRPERFDSQAATFDERAGLAPDVARKVAIAIVESGGAGQDDLVFEIGAGTGEIGLHLAERVRYAGIDRSERMLDVFRDRIHGEMIDRVHLVHSDADEKWPVDEGSVSAVFGSRVVHLLDPDRLQAELERVLVPGGVFLVGRVQRDRNSARARLRQRRQQALKARGIEPRQAEKLTERLLEQLVASGGQPLEPAEVATWEVTGSAEQILDQWSMLTSMGGVALEAAQRDEILADVRRWAERELGDLGRSETSTESYTITGIRMGGTPASANV